MRIVFHVGYPKAGSTLLQRHLLRRDGDLSFLSADARPGTPFCRSTGPKSLERALIDRTPASRQAVAGIWRDEIAPKLAPRKVNVFSQESLVFGGERPGAVFGTIARQITTEADILFILRPQQDLIRSYFDMKRGHSRDWQGLSFDVHMNTLLSSCPGFMRGLMFGRMVEEAMELFGPERVHVLSFHNLFGGGRDVDRLARLLGIDRVRVAEALGKPPAISQQMSAGQSITRRMMGPIRGSWFLPVEVLRGINRCVGRIARRPPTRLSPAEMERIIDLYAEDNSRLAALVPGMERLS